MSSNNKASRPSSSMISTAKKVAPKDPALAAAWQKSIGVRIADAKREGVWVDTIAHTRLPTPTTAPNTGNDPATVDKTNKPPHNTSGDAREEKKRKKRKEEEEKKEEEGPPHSKATEHPSAPNAKNAQPEERSSSPSILISDLPTWPTRKTSPSLSSSIDLRDNDDDDDDDPEYVFVEKSEARHSACNAHADRNGEYPGLREGEEGKGKERKFEKSKGWFF